MEAAGRSAMSLFGLQKPADQQEGTSTQDSSDRDRTATPPTTTTNSSPDVDMGGKLSEDLKHALKQKMEGAGLFETEDEVPGHHHHGDGKTSFITAFASGFVNFLLMFGMCCAYGLIMFSEKQNKKHVPLAIKMNLSAAMLVGILCACCSKIPVAIGGPDINPAVFLGVFIEAMAPEISSEVGLGSYPEGDRRLLGGRGLAEVSADDWCKGPHKALYADECQAYEDELIATTIFATSVSTLMLSIIFLLLGSLKLTRYMAYLPTTIVEAFLACVGYKVFESALKQSEYDPAQFVPAGIIGIGLYFMKAKHIGNPAIVMPLGFLIPLAIFHIGVAITGSTINEARNDDWMFPEISNVDFWDVWTKSIGKPENVNFKAWAKTLPDLATMMIVVCLDCVLKVVATDTKIPVHVDPDYEVRLHGINNFITTWTGSAVGYMQLKFNVINFGITRSATDRRASVIYAVLCGICYFWTLEPFNYLPRFFISSLLFFAGSGFVAENLWGSRGTTSVEEWSKIVIIVLAFILTSSLVIAVLVGGLITFVIFIAKYAKISVIDGAPLRGGEVRIVERMGPLSTLNVRHLLDNWLLVVKLKGYVFFASANTLTNHVGDYMREQDEKQVPAYRRLKYVVFDCSLLDGMDASAAKAMKRLVIRAGRASVRVLWTDLTPSLASELRMRGLLTASSKDVFTDIDEVVMQTENFAKNYLNNVEEKWVSLHPAFEQFSRMTRAQYAFEPFTQILLSPMYRIGCPWKYCSTLRLHGHSTLLFSPGDSNGYLYLMHSGAVALFRELPGPGEEWDSPVAIYRQGWFLNRETLMRAPSRFYGVAIEDGEILCWSPEQWWRMACEMPLMTSEILKTVMKQQARDTDSFDEHALSTVCLSDNAMWDTLNQDLFSRQDSRGTAPSAVQGALPEEIQVKITSIETAQSLEALGFFNNPDDDEEQIFLPHLPPKLKADIDIAFKTYSKKSSKLEASDIPKALMYAGLFHCPEVHDPHQVPTDPINEQQFQDICHKALMAVLTTKQMKTISTLFGIPANNPGASVTLTAAGLQRVLRQVVPAITPELADAFFMTWRGADLSTPLDIDAFTGIMSLLIRLHTPYWDLMAGFRSLIGARKLSNNSQLECPNVVEARQMQGGENMTLLEAEEMIWASDWRTGGQGDGKILGWPELVSALTVSFRRSPGSLPGPCAAEEGGVDAEIISMSSSPSCRELGLPQGVQSRGRLGSQNDDMIHHGMSACSELNLDAKVPKVRESVKEKAVKHVEAWWSRKVRELNAKTCLMSGAVTSLIAVSSLALVLEPVISGEDHEQNNDEERAWLFVEVFITAWLTVELIARLTAVGWHGVVASGHTQVSLLLDVFAAIPLFMDWIAEIFEDGKEDNRIKEMAYDGFKDGAALLRVLRLARVHLFASKTTLAAPVATMMVVVWGIYVKHGFTESK